MYLNDVEEGGETAFPLADQSDEYIEVSLQFNGIGLGQNRGHNLFFKISPYLGSDTRETVFKTFS